MPFIIECDNCGYSRSSDQDGQQFHEVCSICYTDECRFAEQPGNFAEQPGNRVLLCNECYIEEQDSPLIVDPGESLLT